MVEPVSASLNATDSAANGFAYPPGTAHVKKEYLVSLRTHAGSADDDAAEGSIPRSGVDARDGGGGDPRAAAGHGGRKDRDKLSASEKKALRGQNKARRFGKVKDDLDLCWKFAGGGMCEFGETCRFMHDIPTYLLAKPRDIHIPPVASISTSPPFLPSQDEMVVSHPSFPSVDTGTVCPVWREMGECKYGFKCRFLGGHVRISDPSLPPDPAASSSSSEPDTQIPEAEAPKPTPVITLLTDESAKSRAALSSQELNFVGQDVQRMLQKRKYKFPIADAYLRELAAEQAAENAKASANGKKPPNVVAVPSRNSVVLAEPEQEDVVMDEMVSTSTKTRSVAEVVAVPTPVPAPPPIAQAFSSTSTADVESVADQLVESTTTDSDPLVASRTGDAVLAETNGASQADAVDARVRFAEKRRLDWRGKTYLGPLTTVGNLPFRRLCVDLGADITCGEMALSTSFLSGSKEEWSLVRRHPSERTFGVQVAGNKPTSLVPAAEVLAREVGGAGVDFVDVNCGCPIDLVFKSGSGSALLDAPGKLGKILVGMNRALGEIPVTVKLRTGVKDGKPTAHKLMPRLGPEFGVGCVTLHGRSRQQRYTRLADWDYIKQCVDAVRAREKDEDLPTIPIFGGGDCFSSQDYWERVESSGVDGVMIARGALIKPWIFTEIKERREWDISSRERMELVRRYAEYGLNHFGSDTTGVNATRRYLCEALSFQYRYIPIGLLERLPGRINDRAPAFRGRDELETLLASPDSQDWVKISEMFLGPAPETWTFTPKHKSNAYGNEEGQG